MAKKRAKKRSRKGRGPTAKAKKAYNENIIKGFKRLAPVVAKHAPGTFTATVNAASKHLK